MFKLQSIKTQLIIFLTGFAIFLAAKDKDAGFLVALLIAVVFGIIAESVILYIKTKVIQITESSVITGLIVGYVISSDEGWLKLVLAVTIAVFSKYLIRLQKKHIFNPAAFGILLTLVLSGASTQWRGTYYWYILLPFGAYFASKIRKIEILVGYAVAFLLLFGTQAATQNVPLRNIFGYLSYFYIFIMVIEPKTTPIRMIPKLLFGAGVAALIFILTEAGARFDVELFSLLAMNATVPLLNKLSMGRKGGLA